MQEEVRHDRAVEAQNEGDDRETDDGEHVPAIEIDGFGLLVDLRRPRVRQVYDLGAPLTHRRRFRRRPPPRFCPMRYGSLAAISHEAASASGIGIAMVSS